MAPEITNAYNFEFDSQSKKKIQKVQISGYFPDSKIALARQTREKIDEAIVSLSGIENQIFCRADVGQNIDELKNLTAVGDGQSTSFEH